MSQQGTSIPLLKFDDDHEIDRGTSSKNYNGHHDIVLNSGDRGDIGTYNTGRSRSSSNISSSSSYLFDQSSREPLASPNSLYMLIAKKQKQIFEQQRELYNTRWFMTNSTSDTTENVVEDVEEWRELLRIKLMEIRRSEEELRELRLQEMKNFKRDLDLEAIGLAPFVKIPPVAAGQTGTVARKRINSFGKRRDASGSDNAQGRRKWDSVLAITTAANKWKKIWEENKMERAQSILDRGEGLSPVSELTKEQILELRSTLFRLKQKKQLSAKEKLLKKNVSNRLKNMDKSLTERVATSRYGNELTTDDL